MFAPAVAPRARQPRVCVALLPLHRAAANGPFTGRISADAAGGLIGRKFGPKKENLKYSSVAKYFKAVAKYFKF